MTTSVHFQNYDYKNEQKLLEDLVIEAIQIYGHDCFYMPRRRDSFDQLYYEDDTSYYDTAYQIEFYVKSSKGFMGQQSFMSKFGLEVRDEAMFTIARLRFEEEVSQKEENFPRPREGDLIYFPLNKRIFKINYVDDKPFFYQLGELQMYDLTVELLEYSSERFSTGIAEIDDIQQDFSINAYDYAMLAEDGSVLIDEENLNVITSEEMEQDRDIYDNSVDIDYIEEQSDRDNPNNSLLTWDETNPFVNSPDGKY